MRGLDNLQISVVSGATSYPACPPFDPPELYPEFQQSGHRTDEANRVYPMVRESMRLLGMDAQHFGSRGWNPLAEIISPGDRVLIKPNFVMHLNHGQGPLEAVVTHGSVIRAIADYVLLALRGHGELMIGDSPQMDCDWQSLMTDNGMGGVSEYVGERCAREEVKYKIKDFRVEQTYYLGGVVWTRKRLREGVERTLPISLGADSFMEAIDSSLLYGADYRRSETVQAHRNHRHEYLVASDVLAADVIFSVPKLKVHSKVGTTLNLKNMVGINTDKNHLAHFRIGSPQSGGDEISNPRWDERVDRKLSELLLATNWRLGKYPFLGWRALRKLWRVVHPLNGTPCGHGNWKGNDTAWRMALDLNRIVLTARPDGHLESKPVRRYFSFVDGIVGGQGNGPLHPDAYPSGVVIAGTNPVAVDWVATRLMGFDPARIPMYLNAVQQMREWVPGFAIEQSQVMSNIAEWEQVLTSVEPIFAFASAPGWRGAIERYQPCA